MALEEIKAQAHYHRDSANMLARIIDRGSLTQDEADRMELRRTLHDLGQTLATVGLNVTAQLDAIGVRLDDNLIGLREKIGEIAPALKALSDDVSTGCDQVRTAVDHLEINR